MPDSLKAKERRFHIAFDMLGDDAIPKNERVDRFVERCREEGLDLSERQARRYLQAARAIEALGRASKGQNQTWDNFFMAQYDKTVEAGQECGDLHPSNDVLPLLDTAYAVKVKRVRSATAASTIRPARSDPDDLVEPNEAATRPAFAAMKALLDALEKGDLSAGRDVARLLSNLCEHEGESNAQRNKENILAAGAAADAAEAIAAPETAEEGLEKLHLQTRRLRPINLRVAGVSAVSAAIASAVYRIGGFLMQDGHNYVTDATAGTLAALVVHALTTQGARALLADQRDEDAVGTALRAAARNAWGSRWRIQLRSLCFWVATAWPVWLQRWPATEVYANAEVFYRSAAGETWTYSTTPGLVLLPEWGGAKPFSEEFHSLTPKARESISLKNPYRASNFLNGILNGSLNGTRHYQYTSDSSASALVQWRDSLEDPSEREAYIRCTIDHLAGVLQRPPSASAGYHLELTAAPVFDGAKKTFTRTSRTDQMLSVRSRRHQEHIGHAIHFSCLPLQRRLITTHLGSAAAAATGGAIGSPLLLLAAVLVGAGAEVSRGSLERVAPSAVATRHTRELDDPQAGIVVIKRAEEELDAREAHRRAEAEVERLLGVAAQVPV